MLSSLLDGRDAGIDVHLVQVDEAPSVFVLALHGGADGETHAQAGPLDYLLTVHRPVQGARVALRQHRCGPSRENLGVGVEPESPGHRGRVGVQVHEPREQQTVGEIQGLAGRPGDVGAGCHDPVAGNRHRAWAVKPGVRAEHPPRRDN
jgi:hypothetical protein